MTAGDGGFRNGNRGSGGNRRSHSLSGQESGCPGSSETLAWLEDPSSPASSHHPPPHPRLLLFPLSWSSIPRKLIRTSRPPFANTGGKPPWQVLGGRGVGVLREGRDGRRISLTSPQLGVGWSVTRPPLGAAPGHRGPLHGMTEGPHRGGPSCLCNCCRPLANRLPNHEHSTERRWRAPATRHRCGLPRGPLLSPRAGELKNPPECLLLRRQLLLAWPEHGGRAPHASRLSLRARARPAGPSMG